MKFFWEFSNVKIQIFHLMFMIMHHLIIKEFRQYVKIASMFFAKNKIGTLFWFSSKRHIKREFASFIGACRYIMNDKQNLKDRW